MKPLFRIAPALRNAPGPRAVTGTPEPHVVLPTARTTGGRPLMDALMARRTVRDFAVTMLDPQTLGDLLWAAAGINRPDTGERTAPSVLSMHEIDIYVLIANGSYRYDPASHCLDLVAAADLRSLTGYQDFIDHAPLDLVYVADLARMSDVPQMQREVFAAVSVGAMLQNVYLYCASTGLAASARGWMNRTALAEHLHLPPDATPMLAQTVGHPDIANGDARAATTVRE